MEEIAVAGGPLLAEGIRRMRGRRGAAGGGLRRRPGVIRLFHDEADRLATVQSGFFRGEESFPQRRGDTEEKGGRKGR